MNDKDNTFIFKPDEIEILEDKPHVDRSPRDEYSRARITVAPKEARVAVVITLAKVMGLCIETSHYKSFNFQSPSSV